MARMMRLIAHGLRVSVSCILLLAGSLVVSIPRSVQDIQVRASAQAQPRDSVVAEAPPHETAPPGSAEPDAPSRAILVPEALPGPDAAAEADATET